MALHYHGLPMTPAKFLERMQGANICISHATQRAPQTAWALRHAQSILWDNGAFTYHQREQQLDPNAFYDWIAPNLGHPHWAVVPDVIGGSEAEQRALRKTWPFAVDLGAPVWHLGLGLDYLLELADNYPRICFGSSARYWRVGYPEWEERMDEAFDYLFCRRQQLPWVHGLRMLSQLGKRWPLASADSVNVSRNFKTNYKSGEVQCPGCMAVRIDSQNGPHVRWPGSPLA